MMIAPACHGGAGAPSAVGSLTHPGQTAPPATPSARDTFEDPIDVAIDADGTVWVANYRDSTLDGFPRADLRGISGRTSVAPSVVLSGLGGPNQIQFDVDGNLWVAAWDSDSIDEYAAAALDTSGRPEPIVTIRGAQVRAPTDLVFDDQGGLWVANQSTGSIIRFASADLRSGGRPRPDVVLRAFPEGTPQALAFAGQQLWVSDYDDDVISIFEPDQIARSGSPPPAARLLLPDLSGPIGLTFHDDRMWVAEATADTVAVFPASARGRIDPAMVIRDEACVMPHTVTFGSGGSVWVPCYNGTVLRFEPDGSRRASGPPSLVLS
jgi:sugar lactone lactonase YvrE